MNMGSQYRTDHPSREYLRSLIDYDPFSGRIAFKAHKGNRKAGEELRPKEGEYLNIKIDGRVWKAHRLIWVWMTDTLPESDIDHINGLKSDNRWENLREASRSQNICNTPARRTNLLGVKGVRLLKDTGKFQVRVKGKSYGCYSTIEEARNVSERVYKEVDGDFSWMVREVDESGRPRPYRPPG